MSNKTPRQLSFGGYTRTVAEWAKTIGVEADIIHNRLFQGWTAEKALTTPIHQVRKIEFNGQNKTVREWALQLGCSVATLNQRMRAGESVEQIFSNVRKMRGRAEESPNWKGGKFFDTHGYVMICINNDDPLVVMGRQFVTGGSYYVLEHRLVMARYLGRPLLSSETVHHINGDRADNRIENLQLRIGQHGKGQAYCCAECGSNKLNPIDL